MTEVRVSDFEKQIIVRPTKKSDYNALVEMQKKCFPNMRPWKREEIESTQQSYVKEEVIVTKKPITETKTITEELNK